MLRYNNRSGLVPIPSEKKRTAPYRMVSFSIFLKYGNHVFSGSSLTDLLHHRQNNAIWSPIALAIDEKMAKVALLRVRCNNSNMIFIWHILYYSSMCRF